MPGRLSSIMRLLIVGADSIDVLRQALRDAFGADALFLPVLSHLTPEFDSLVVTVCGTPGPDDDDAPAVSARAARVPSLTVRLRPDDVLIGPLTLPDRAGCARCVHRRLRAALIGNQIVGAAGTAPTAATPDISVAMPALVSEIRALTAGGRTSSRLLNRILRVDLSTGGASLHRALPMPHCAVCGGAAALDDRFQAQPVLSRIDSVDAVPDALDGIVDPLTGLIPAVAIEPCAADGLPVIATAAPPHVIADDGTVRRLPVGWGKGLTRADALLSAVGEAIERYAASMPDLSRVAWSAIGDLTGDLLDPRAFALYSDEQYARADFPFVRFDPAVRHPWVSGRWLDTGAPVWVPAVFAYLSFILRREHHFCQGTSNGLAAGVSYEDAARRASFELVERDAFMTAWLTATPGIRVELDATLDPALQPVLQAIRSLGPSVETYLLRSACGSAALCLGIGDGDRWPAVTLGLGAAADARGAIRHALLELAQTGPHLRRLMQCGALPVPSEPHAVREMLHHAAYYFPRERAAAFDHIRGSGGGIRLADLPVADGDDSLACCAANLTSAGVRVVLVDVTSADVAMTGFRVVRAVSPDLQPISYGYGFDRMPVARVRACGLRPDVGPVHPIW